MPEENKVHSKQLLITALMVILIVFVAIQTWYLTGMRKQLDELQNLQATTQSLIPETITRENADSETASSDAVQPATAQIETAQAGVTPPESAEKQQQSVVADSRQTPSQSDSQADILTQAQTQPLPKPQPQANKRKPIPGNPPPVLNDDFFNSPYDQPSWDLYEEIERMQREMDRLFYNSFNRPYGRPENRRDYQRPDFQYFSHQDLSLPEMDVKEDRTQYIILVNLPGADENDVSISLNGQRLMIKGKRMSQKQNRSSDGNIVFSERRSGNFKRSITLPEPVIESGMKSKIENGVLTIVIPKYKRPA